MNPTQIHKLLVVNRINNKTEMHIQTNQTYRIQNHNQACLSMYTCVNGCTSTHTHVHTPHVHTPMHMHPGGHTLTYAHTPCTHICKHTCTRHHIHTHSCTHLDTPPHPCKHPNTHQCILPSPLHTACKQSPSYTPKHTPDVLYIKLTFDQSSVLCCAVL